MEFAQVLFAEQYNIASVVLFCGVLGSLPSNLKAVVLSQFQIRGYVEIEGKLQFQGSATVWMRLLGA